MRTPKEAVIPPSAVVAGALHGTPTQTTAERVLAWVGRHRQGSAYGGAAILVAAILVVWNISATRRSEVEARSNLANARIAFESRNMGLASSELARVRENYSGTKAAEEATLLLAQVRLSQGQTDQALQLLQDFAPGASRDYRAQGYGLLAAALENAGKLADAAQAYERAGDAASLDFMKAQYLSDAGRTWVTAGDTARAVATYRRVATDLAKTTQANEATLRLGELTKGTVTP